MRLLSLPTLVLGLLLPTVAAAEDYEPGIVPEGNNAFVHARREIRIAPLGATSVGLTDRTELSTYLVGDALLFPNLELEHQLEQSEHFAMSFVLGAGAGAYPVAVGFFLPLPGAIVAGGGVGVAWGSIQSATANFSLRAPDRALAISFNAGAFAVEGGLVGVVGGGGAGGGGAGGTGGPAEAHGMRTGLTTGVEVARTFGRRDALVAAVDVWTWQSLIRDSMNPEPYNGLLYPRVTWTHKWTRWSLTGGAYSMIDLPKADALHSKMPVGPYFNFAYSR